MKYPFETKTIIDVTKPPYNADNTGKSDCTAILRKVLDDILSRYVDGMKKMYDDLIELSDNCKEDAYIGIEGGRVQDGKVTITFPEFLPPTRIVYFPEGTYLISDTLTYTLENLKNSYYWVPYYETCINIQFMGESREKTIIRLKDNAEGYQKGSEKPVVSFINNETETRRDKEKTNIAFMNNISDITIDCGKRNSGAIGIKYISSNIGRIENVEVKTEEGYCGVSVLYTSQGVFEDIKVSGFDYGFDLAYTCMLFFENIDYTECKRAGILAEKATLISKGLKLGNIPAMEFTNNAKEPRMNGRYYFIDNDVTFANEGIGEEIYIEKETPAVSREIPKNPRNYGDDWACVDGFGAVGDGVTDSTRAIQRAMNSGKSHILFGDGIYRINGKIKIPATVKNVDFLYCSFITGDRLIGGEFDSAFEVTEDSEDILFLENLMAFEQFKGHIRLLKHGAKRDLVMKNIMTFSASMYFNSVPGSRVYFDNCFLTTGTYTYDAWLPGRGFVPVYSHILPYEFHGQMVYGRQMNPERADMAMLCDSSDVLLDGFRTEGSGTAIKIIGESNVEVHLCNAGIGRKAVTRPIFDIEGGNFSVTGMAAFGFSEKSEYHTLIRDKESDTTILWDDVEEYILHLRSMNHYKN